MTQRAPAFTLATVALSDEERAAHRRVLGTAIFAAALLGAAAGLLTTRGML